jgi:S-adenosylmethionine:tRNA ribosyltransferase-isomerase
VLVSDFDFPLPPELIAQHPAPHREDSRLLVVHRAAGRFEHESFPAFPDLLRTGDLLVVNDSRVFPARIRGLKPDTGGHFEILLLHAEGATDWWTLLRPGKRVRPGSELHFTTPEGHPTPWTAVVQAKNEEGHVRLRFPAGTDVLALAEAIGEIPLPPYIHRAAGPSSTEDRARYQTVYAGPSGSVAAPTAGLHLSPGILDRLAARGIELHRLTLHVGAGTFLPVKAEQVEAHRMHEEHFRLPAATAAAISRAKAEGRRVVAVGTTTLRVLESVAQGLPGHPTPPASAAGSLSLPPVEAGRTRIFVHPPFRFRVVDALLTNFHLPQSTLLMLVSAFAAPGELHAGRELILRAYAEAIREQYRFFSYGDAMFLT